MVIASAVDSRGLLGSDVRAGDRTTAGWALVVRSGAEGAWIRGSGQMLTNCSSGTGSSRETRRSMLISSNATAWARSVSPIASARIRGVFLEARSTMVGMRSCDAGSLFAPAFYTVVMSTAMTGRYGAGAFGDWLREMRAVLRGERDADVPCGPCVGCCVSSYPIPLRPGDELARREVPEQWLIGATPAGGNWLMGFREDGSCPFLRDRCCSIYSGRPQTCRDYDCRIYAAAGLMPDGERPVIADRVRAWEFSFSTGDEHLEADAVRRAAHFIRAHQEHFPAAMRAGSATAAAVLAVKSYEIFLAPVTTVEDTVHRVIEAVRAFDAGPVTVSR